MGKKKRGRGRCFVFVLFFLTGRSPRQRRRAGHVTTAPWGRAGRRVPVAAAVPARRRRRRRPASAAPRRWWPAPTDRRPTPPPPPPPRRPSRPSPSDGPPPPTTSPTPTPTPPTPPTPTRWGVPFFDARRCGVGGPGGRGTCRTAAADAPPGSPPWRPRRRDATRLAGSSLRNGAGLYAVADVDVTGGALVFRFHFGVAPLGRTASRRSPPPTSALCQSALGMIFLFSFWPTVVFFLFSFAALVVGVATAASRRPSSIGRVRFRLPCGLVTGRFFVFVSFLFFFFSLLPAKFWHRHFFARVPSVRGWVGGVATLSQTAILSAGSTGGWPREEERKKREKEKKKKTHSMDCSFFGQKKTFYLRADSVLFRSVHWRTHTHTHTHKKKQKRNAKSKSMPPIAEQREVHGGGGAWNVMKRPTNRKRPLETRRPFEGDPNDVERKQKKSEAREK